MAVSLLNQSDLVIQFRRVIWFSENTHSFHSPTFLTNIFTFYPQKSSTQLSVNVHIQQGGERRRDDIGTKLQKEVKITTDI